jgi:hypothetical protein
MGLKKINYSEGSCFSIPLREGGYARGVVTRMDSDGTIFGYFFGPKIGRISEVCVDANLCPDQAVFCGRFGDLGLLNEEWQVIGNIQNWSREKWSMPPFLRFEEGSLTGFLSTYGEDFLDFINEREVDLSTINVGDLPKDSVMGYGFVEIKLTKLL